MDKILISDLAVRCIIGINDEERREKQDLLINMIIYADIHKACRSDRFEDSVDYRSIKKKIIKMVEDSRYHLVEALAEAIASICLENPTVARVMVRVDKPGALRFARSVAIEIERGRE